MFHAHDFLLLFIFLRQPLLVCDGARQDCAALRAKFRILVALSSLFVSHIDIVILACHPTAMRRLEQVHEASVGEHCSPRTEESCPQWIERFSDSIESEFGDTSIPVRSVSSKAGRTDSRKDAKVAKHE
jgi:hypothetical protein